MFPDVYRIEGKQNEQHILQKVQKTNKQTKKIENMILYILNNDHNRKNVYVTF